MSAFMTDLPAHSSTGSNGLFTCLSCQIKFPSAEMQRIHMKTEWHRYNLKRRVAELPAVDAEVFELKVLQQRVREEQYDEFGFVKLKEKTPKKTLRERRIARSGRPNIQRVVERSLSPVSAISSASTFTLGTASEITEVGFAEDLLSEGVTTDTERYFSTDEEEGDFDSDLNAKEIEEFDLDEEDQEIPVTACFYCDQKSNQLETNVNHMFRKHGLYIPERSYLADIEGLLSYISNSIALDKQCLKCGFIGKNLESIRQHVIEKGHCVLPYETKDERDAVKQFYNFDTTLEQHKGENKSVTFEEIDDVIECWTSEYTTATLDETGTQLCLPNGVRLGNRKYARYYKQNIPDIRDKVILESEKTVATVYAKADELNRLRERLRKQEIREIGIIEMRGRSRDIARQLKKCNNNKYFRDEIL
ncbi:hypothetical protein FOA43_004786 [Brettanomyces nanus]|uniref:C2H2-type domain-containing protein n=1 Tax=Eeniella nana TaxID=13502 RepID=A0A875S924_EENNA|nr:uncharacterized protein FOA43_004786 [Brettanomyces nanus]QPG77373.1 hypothetical protein FOA43_004786 [Brettanomyces nanus]